MRNGEGAGAWRRGIVLFPWQKPCLGGSWGDRAVEEEVGPLGPLAVKGLQWREGPVAAAFPLP